ncbi:hypothetical protein [Streptomyces sp. H27-D2]|uniref:hypothetical protein n=1 Tax=Streptomyces sp. H27-D2 TaxID=3046304 RepID=UPI002DB84A4C|nr:hypothetical protein [Streptomyces sp. H27-D2]MEC4018238.1 hypothetical protein [Streptomyces sp. H27-D2]
MRAIGLDDPMILGLHGVFVRHPWIDQVSAGCDLDEDVFSLAINRAAAYGWSFPLSSDREEVRGQRWGHNDADGDWTEDGSVRELAWLQVEVEDLRGQRLPVLPMATVLGDGLRRVGTFRLTGMHTLAPVHLAADGSAELRGAAAWFRLADPHHGVDLTVEVSARAPDRLAARAPEILDLVRERNWAGTGIETAPAGRPRDGLAEPAEGEIRYGGMRPALALRCRAPEWSLNVAAWATDLLVDALRAARTAERVLITVTVPAGEPQGG